MKDLLKGILFLVGGVVIYRLIKRDPEPVPILANYSYERFKEAIAKGKKVEIDKERPLAYIEDEDGWWVVCPTNKSVIAQLKADGIQEHTNTDKDLWLV